MRPRPAAFFAGVLWGLVAWGLAGRVYGRPGLWGGLVAAPMIGIAVAAVLQARFENTAGWRRWILALGSLYLGATLFALAVGLTDALSGSASRNRLDVVVEAVIGTWWGVTLTGFVIALWPLAYLTHIVLEWVDGLSPDRSSHE